MENHLKKYYPGIKQGLHEMRIKRITEALEKEKIEYEKEYKKPYKDETV